VPSLLTGFAPNAAQFAFFKAILPNVVPECITNDSPQAQQPFVGLRYSDNRYSTIRFKSEARVIYGGIGDLMIVGLSVKIGPTGESESQRAIAKT
jgi:hypothetical protein